MAFTLPAAQILPDNIIAAGHSSGSFMSAQLKIAYPEIFQGVGLLNGGLPGAAPRMGTEYMPMLQIQALDALQEAKKTAWDKSWKFISKLAHAEKIGDQSHSSGKPVYIFGGQKDHVVPIPMTLEQDNYFYLVNAAIEYVEDANFGHHFPEKTIAGQVSDYCYKTLGVENWSLNEYTIMDDGQDYFHNNGWFGQWDQQQFVDEIQSEFSSYHNTVDAEYLNLRKWGFYYIPKSCATKSCKFQLILHGCTQSAENFAKYWGPFAAKNDIVMVFPQAKVCWDNGFEFGRPAWLKMDRIYTREGAQNLFMKAIVDRMMEDRDEVLKETQAQISKELNIVKQGESPYNHPSDFYIKMTDDFSMHAECSSAVNESGKLAGDCVNKQVMPDGSLKPITTEEMMQLMKGVYTKKDKAKDEL